MARGARPILKKCRLFILLIGMLCTIFSLAWPQTTAAAQLTGRSLKIEAAAPGAQTRHTFTFSFASNDSVGSIVFEYCTSPLRELACVAPSGLDATGATLAQQTGETGFALLNVGSNRLVLSRAAAPPAQNPSQYMFDNVANPTTAPASFYARITTYESTDATGPMIDFGAVVNSTTEGVEIASEVPPILKFCVGLDLTQDCSSADDNIVDLGTLSPALSSSGTSQMIAATNADFGLAISVHGTTMTSGNNAIPALSTPTPSAPGNAQFGINLRKNNDPSIGQEPVGIGIANPTSAYNLPNRYTFVNGDVVATSPDVTDTRRFTVSYVANISPSQPPGLYTTTLTYVCTASF